MTFWCRAVLSLLCYEPLFGYALELPFRTLRPGSVFAVREGCNLKNPVCYVYPLENACEPGEHFLVDQQEVAKAFSTYKPIPLSSASVAESR